MAQTTGERLDFHVALATYYILDRVWRLSKKQPPPPVVINTSFGYIAGPHDGTGPVERYFDFVTAHNQNPTRFVLPAGNAQLSRCHAVIDLVTHTDVDLEWIVQPDDKTHSVVQVWLPDRGANRMTMTVVLPDGTVSPPIPDTPWQLGIPDPSTTIVDAAGRVCGLLEFGPYLQRSLFHLAIFPTERAQPDTRRLAPAGEWRLRFHRTGAQGVVADAWVQRDNSLYGYPQAGRQSYFDDPGYVRFAEANFGLRGDVVTDDEDPAQLGIPTPVTRASLFNAIATGASVVTAGGFHERNLRLAGYSAGGPNTPPEAAPLTQARPAAAVGRLEGPSRHAGRRLALGRAGGVERHQRRRPAAGAVRRRQAGGRATGRPHRRRGAGQPAQPAAAVRAPGHCANPGDARPGRPARPRRRGPAAATRSAARGALGVAAVTHASR